MVPQPQQEVPPGLVGKTPRCHNPSLTLDRMADVRLDYELVPKPLWGVSVYRALKGSRWDRLRREVLEEAAGRCQCCGECRARGMVCHEVWDYNDDRGQATLVGFRIICPDCNFVTHRGMAGNIGLAEVADAHMALVNDLGIEEARRLYRDAFVVWAERSQRQWTAVIDPRLVERYPILNSVPFGASAA